MDVESYSNKIRVGRDNIYQGIIFSKSINTDFLFIKKNNCEIDFYSFLMTKFNLPILREWVSYIFEQVKIKQFVKNTKVRIIGTTRKFDEYEVFQMMIAEEDLRNILSEGLKRKIISIAEEEQKSLKFEDMDDYFKKYGHTLVDNLEKILVPLSPMKEKVDELVFMNKRLFPQQAAIINGAVESLNRRNYTFLIESMGAGKTLQGMGVVEAFHNKEYLKLHSDKTIKDVYMDGSLVKYRTFIMCPPHLIEKWEKSIKEEIPYAHVEIIEKLSQLVEMKKRGKESLGKEYYIVSKDTGKLSYSYMPVPYQIKSKYPKVPVCSNCNKNFFNRTDNRCGCGCKEWTLVERVEIVQGLICTECGELILPADGRNLIDEVTGKYQALQPEDFAQQNRSNHFCCCCGSILWSPACRPIDGRILFRTPKKKPKKWKKISHYANKAMKARKSVWVMASQEERYKESNEIQDSEIEEMEIWGPRKFAMSRYIKKHLKGFFDFLIVDEVQDYKAGGSAQGYSMHDLVKASKKQLALTGTIAGGYASDLFYTLYRLDARRMKKMGYQYGLEGEKKFIEKYGTVETVYAFEETGKHNQMSRGRRVVAPQRCLPGISVLIFIDFLLDTALFLDLSDLSRYLPYLFERVIFVPLEDEIQIEYQRVRKILRKQMIENKDNTLNGNIIQFSLSYTDLPYGREKIVSPKTGEVLVNPKDLFSLVENNKLLNKEKELVELVESEQKEKRNCFIYCEYTGNGENSISYRLKEVLEKNCNLSPEEVVVLESSYPAAAKREQWMHQKASEGAKVFITNVKCVATGLDFAFKYKNKLYNYPTIIFYQTGYEMLKIWQGSRRHYRLNQVEDCRTYFLVSERTIQPDAVALVATKEVATSAIQGQFSAEGLYAMARGLDPRVVLAQSVAGEDQTKEHGLRAMMDVLNKHNNQDKKGVTYEKMLIFSELTGWREVPCLDNIFSVGSWTEDIDPMQFLNLGTGADIVEQNQFDILEYLEESQEQKVIESELTEFLKLIL